MNNNQQQLEQWTKGIAYEVAFWNNATRWDKTFLGTMEWSHLGGAITLEGFDAQQFLRRQAVRKVLDVGCGMSFATGNHLEEEDGRIVPLDIHYVDPLAHYFNAISCRHRRELPEIEFGLMEYLSAFHPNGDTSLVVIQNALDHSAQPVKGIIEALQTVSIGGVVYLNHHPNEAETEHYKGFHQYNIIGEDGRLYIWNRHERCDINDLVSGFATIDVQRMADTGHVIAVIRKTAEVPAHLLTDKHDIQTLCAGMMSATLQSQHITHAVGYRLRYWLLNVIQFFAQSLSYETKMKVKKLIKQDSHAHE